MGDPVTPGWHFVLGNRVWESDEEKEPARHEEKEMKEKKKKKEEEEASLVARAGSPNSAAEHTHGNS